jgi:hypothetical protein
MRLVDEASAVANGDAVRRRIRGRAGGAPAAVTLVLGLAACAADGRPSLYEVPARPVLSATVQERRAIGAALEADRAAAALEAAALRQRTGKAALPPPAWLLEPPPRPPAPTPRPTAAPPNVEAAIVAERIRSESDDDSLNSFLRQLVRRQPAADGLGAAAAFAEEDEPFGPEQRVAAGPAGRAAPTPDSPALDRFLDQLGGRLAVGRPEPAEPASTPPEPAAAVPPASATAPRPAVARPAPPASRPPAPTPAAAPPAAPAAREPPLASLPPPSPGGTLPAAARAELERAATAARERGAGLEVVGHGATPAVALERARAVARLVAETGLPPGGLALRAAGPGERVELHLLARPPS